MPRLRPDVETLCQAAGLPPPLIASASLQVLQLTVYTALQTHTGPGGAAEAKAKLVQRHGAPEACVSARQPPGPLPPCLSVPILPSSRHRDDP